MAVTFVATGGLTLAGGVLPRVVDFLDEAAFRQAFEAKAPVDGLAKRIRDPARHAGGGGADRNGGDRRRARALRHRLRISRLGLGQDVV